MPASESSETVREPSPCHAQSRYEEETEDRGLGALHNIRSRTRSRTDETLISWEVDDPENPVNWLNVWLL
ncbi:hypothetical protein ACHAPO_005724 [Fusarium lateritium]